MVTLGLGVLGSSACGGAKDELGADLAKRDDAGWPVGLPKVPGAKALAFESNASSFKLEFSAPGSGGKTIFWYRGHLGPIGWVSRDGEYMTDDNTVYHIDFAPPKGRTGALSMTIDQTENGDSHVALAFSK
jgi:hypothetical protein